MPAFKLFEIDTPVQTKKEKKLQEGRVLSCIGCGLYQSVLTPRMKPYGKGKKNIMLIGEGPGETEDRVGKPWQGRAGTRLQEELHKFDINLARDCISLNSVACRPPNNRAPSGYEMMCCHVKTVDPAIKEYQPKLIILFGGSPVASVLGKMFPDALDGTIGRWRGFCIPIPELNCWICPTFHPSYILREEGHKEVSTIWRQDIERALDHLDSVVPEPENLRDKVILLKNEDDILKALRRAKRERLFAHDYETTGLRAVSHDIVCASFATSEDRSYAFMFPKSEKVRNAWIDILADDRIGKMAHNIKFEYEWARRKFGIDRMNWYWDSMQGAHVLDNRAKINGLKIQSFINFGIRSYDDLIAPFLEAADKKNPQSQNRILEFIDRYGEDECLIYCGIDGLLNFRLAMKQQRLINGNE